jgi:hypothetical protein
VRLLRLKFFRNSKYNMSPGAGGSSINVTATLSAMVQRFSDKKAFRIKGFLGPTGTIRGEMGCKRT